MTAAPVMAKLSCRHTVEVAGTRAEGDKVPCYLCPERKSGGQPMRTVKHVERPEPVLAGPPPRCPAAGKVGLDGPGSSRCPACTQDHAPVKRDGTLGSHKLLRPRGGK